MLDHPQRWGLRRAIALALAVGGSAAAAAALASPASAPASAPMPTIQLSHPCYETAERATLKGTGFAASSAWSARLDGAHFGSGTTTSSGDITATFGVPSHLRKGSTGEDAYKLVVRQGKNSASATFLVTHLDASFKPQSGDISTLKVRFTLLGWGRGGMLYLHMVTPKGVSRMDRNLGAPQGACGHLTTSPLKLFPFTPKVGKWSLQFDKSKTYSSTSVPRVVIPYKVS
jgi:hypothetical protein